MKPLLAIAALVAAAGFGPATAASLLTNGSFESETVPAGNYLLTQNLTGWVGGSNKIEVRNALVGTAYDGNNFVELDALANSSMSQTFSTVTGDTYLLSFAYAARPSNGAESNGITWSAGDHQAVAFGQNTNTAWVVMSTSFIATSNLTTLTFAAIGTSDGLGTSLDAVSVTALVPEPESYALLAAGLAVIGAMRRRRASDRI